MSRFSTLTWSLLAFFAFGSIDLLAAEPALTFEDDVLPILQVRCINCHGGETTKSGLDLRRKFTLLAGGDSGPAIVPGKPAESLLIEKIEAKEMPPKDEDPLDAKQIEVLKRWIAAGAAIKGAQELPLEATDDDGSVTDADRQFWAFQPPVRREPPPVRANDRVRTPIDAFLLAKLEEQGLSFNPDASKAVLLRRLCFDLTGLPPTDSQIDKFLADNRPEAYEELVNELLASQHYGERWGRHWLDVAGYADSDGFLEADRERPEAWRYRDYVIRSLNADKPYDRFLREQLAGDELSNWRRAEELTQQQQDELIATGFLRTASDPTYPGYKEKPEIYKVMADTVQIVGSAFLGVTVQCARCHAHKSEPISQRDYYQLQAIFNASYDPDRWLASSERAVPLASELQQARVNAWNAQIDQRVAQLASQINEYKSRVKAALVDDKLASLGRDVADQFDGPALAPAWSLRFDGTASGWTPEFQDGRLVVKDIAGKQGYAIVRLSKAVSLGGEFRAEGRFSWTGQDTSPDKSTAMQVLLVNLRDPQGNVVATQGYVDENSNQRGSPIAGVGVGPDVIAHYLKKHQQAVPPDKFCHSLAASGTAAVTISRDANGAIVTTFDDGTVRQETTGTLAGTVSEVEIELRRYVLTPGATFEGLSVDHISVTGPQQSLDDATRAALRQAVLSPQQTDEQKKLLAERAPRLVLTDTEVTHTLKSRHPEWQSEIERIQAVIQSEESLKKSLVQLRGLADLDDKPAATHVLRRGDWNSKGRAVGADVPAVLSAVDAKFTPQAGYKTSGRRRAFADWLVDPRHPTTARVHVNRLWAHHFGRGLVETLDDFGHLGKRPTHPELLDWLASEFIAPPQGWKQKSLHKLFVMSTAYRQSSISDPAKVARDPENTLLWAFRPQRHEGEVVRDSLLMLAGKLNPKMFGSPVPVVPQADGSIATAADAEGNRRSIYLKVRRSQPVTLLESFDTPRMEVNCTRRTEAIVATQALVLQNNPVVESAAAALAQRITAAAPDRDGRIAKAYRWLFTREPSPEERQAIHAFLDDFAKSHLGDKFATATPADLAAADSAAWPHLALTLLNANEFLWVD